MKYLDDKDLLSECQHGFMALAGRPASAMNPCWPQPLLRHSAVGDC